MIYTFLFGYNTLVGHLYTILYLKLSQNEPSYRGSREIIFARKLTIFTLNNGTPELLTILVLTFELQCEKMYLLTSAPNVQANLNLHWAHMSEGMLCDLAAHLEI